MKGATVNAARRMRQYFSLGCQFESDLVEGNRGSTTVVLNLLLSPLNLLSAANAGVCEDFFVSDCRWGPADRFVALRVVLFAPFSAPRTIRPSGEPKDGCSRR
jgi:hypothetical protein